ncbi:MAG: hypothetical protein RML99_09365 [Anaerolineae bacterium]|nr:hypothetical protein [Anaerolineae bacterium]
MTSLPEALKVELRIEINGRPLVISAQVQGEGELARRAAAELSAAIVAVLNATDHSARPAALEGTAEALSTQHAAAFAPSASAEAPSTKSAEAVPDAARANSAPESSSVSPNSPPSSLVERMQRYRAQISLGIGSLLLALAVLVPLIVPPSQRREAMIMTILFGLTGALLLFTAMLPGRGHQATSTAAAPSRKPMPPAPQAMGSTSARLRLMPKRRTAMKAGWGIVLGVAFVLLGMLAPFTLGATTADERFIIMLGFAPITVVGFFLIAIFGRSLITRQLTYQAIAQPRAAPQPAGAAQTKRAATARVPQTLGYRAIVPAAIIGLLGIMIAIVGVIIYATATAAMR